MLSGNAFQILITRLKKKIIYCHSRIHMRLGQFHCMVRLQPTYGAASSLGVIRTPTKSLNDRSLLFVKLFQPHEAQLMLTNPRDAFRGQSRSPNMVTHQVRLHLADASLTSSSSPLSSKIVQPQDQRTSCQSIKESIFRLLRFSRWFLNELILAYHSICSGVARILCQGTQVWRCKKTENNKCMYCTIPGSNLYSRVCVVVLGLCVIHIQCTIIK